MDRLEIGNYNNGKPGQFDLMNCPLTEKPDFARISQNVHSDWKLEPSADTDTRLIFEFHNALLKSWQ